MRKVKQPGLCIVSIGVNRREMLTVSRCVLATFGVPRLVSVAHHENNVLGRVVADGKLEELDLVPVCRERTQKLCPDRTRTTTTIMRRPGSST